MYGQGQKLRRARDNGPTISGWAIILMREEVTEQQRQSFYREVAQVFIVSWWNFDKAFDELMRVLEKYGFTLPRKKLPIT